MKKNQFLSMIMLVVFTLPIMVSCSSESEENDISESGLKEILVKDTGRWIYDRFYTENGFDICSRAQFKGHEHFWGLQFTSHGMVYFNPIYYSKNYASEYTIEGNKIVINDFDGRERKFNIIQHRKLNIPYFPNYYTDNIISKEVEALITDSIVRYTGTGRNETIVFVNYDEFKKQNDDI